MAYQVITLDHEIIIISFLICLVTSTSTYEGVDDLRNFLMYENTVLSTQILFAL